MDSLPTDTNYGNAGGVALTGTTAGAASGAVTGAAVGGTIGAIGGAVGGAGVGAGPGFVVGAGTGATAGAISGGISGFITAAFADGYQDAAQTGAVGGAISGAMGGLGSGIGTFGAGGTQPLTHYTSPACAQSIRSGLQGQGQLGLNASSNLFATTGRPAFTTLTNTSAAVPIPPASAGLFRPWIPTGPITAFGYTAGHQIGPRGVINLTTGAIVSGGTTNTAAVGWIVVDIILAGISPGFAVVYTTP